jgi:ABC-2 type transport system ATP-binding protein
MLEPVSRETDAPLALVVKGLRKSYDAIEAVAGIAFTLRAGEIVGLLGGNGAGKTTTIAMILGLVEPTAGTIEILGHDAASERHRVAPLINFESPYVDMPLRLTVRQNLTVYAMLYGVADIRGRIADLARALDLSALLDRPTGRLSAGQKTRVSLAKALVNEPRLLLLDEPTASLDPDTADWVRSHLERYCRERGASMLLASHNMGEVERLCSRVLMMKAGRIVAEGSPASLIRKFGRRNMEEVFLDIARGRARGKEEAERA